MSGHKNKTYRRSLEASDTAMQRASGDEFIESLDLSKAEVRRRDFLKAAGFAFAGGVLAGCAPAPVEKAIPYLIQPEEVIPGRAYYYASTCGACSAGCGLLVKNRDGRPIKLEGNPDHPVSRGGLCALGQANVLELYDSLRLKQPLRQGQPSSWEEVDRAIATALDTIRMNKGAVRFLSGTITSPTLQASIRDFLASFSGGRHVIYDPLSSSAILDAHEQTHGVRVLPRYRFERAEVIVSFDADFLGTWISPVEFTRGYAEGRSLAGSPPRFSYHVQFESRLSLTGSKADRRVRVAPHELGVILTQLAARVAKQVGIAWDAGGVNPSVPAAVLDDVATRLAKARGCSLVVCGEQNRAAQIVCNFLNHVLGNYQATLDLERPSFERQGNDRDLESLLREMDEGQISALFIHGVNPLYDLPMAGEFGAALERVPLVVSLAERDDETAAMAHFVCPDHHPLESWGDAEAVSGVVSLAQPAIRPLGSTRSVLESLAAWSGAPRSAYDILRASWEKNIFPRQKRETSFQGFWDRTLHDGFAEVEPRRVQPKPFNMAAVQPVPPAPEQTAEALTLVLYPKVAMLDGRHAHNAWLHELPDPITKATWDNYACVSVGTAARWGVATGDVVRLEVSGRSLELPALVQPGQHEGTIAVALGYGRKGTERFASVGPRWFQARPSVGDDGRVGKRAAPLLELADGLLRYTRAGVKLTKTGQQAQLALTKSHHTITVPKTLAPAGAERRPIIEEMTLPVFLERRAAGEKGGRPDEREDLWPRDHPFPEHRWAMMVDLNACTGCSACVVACQAENNIPVVGKDEVRRQREMHWLRIDRYYSDEGDDVDVAHQPMLCQQCEHAPCETVCPVLATVHSEEGLNQQIYNRCVGTRYCANNCPYKVRRFNWFNYPRQDHLQNLVLNPDVTVRSRGVMEKCTFCVQRIQEAKIEA